MMDDNRCFLAANHLKPLEHALLTVKYGARNALHSLCLYIYICVCVCLYRAVCKTRIYFVLFGRGGPVLTAVISGG